MQKRSLENLTDVELHRKLLEYNLPSLIVTETTRPLIIKKLKAHIQNVRRSERMLNSTPQRTYETNNRNNNMSTTYPSRHSYKSPLTTTTTTKTPTTSNTAATGTTPYSLRNTICDTNYSPAREFFSICYAGASSDSEDDSLYRDKISLTERPNPHVGVVGRLLNFRDSTLHKKHLTSSTNENMDFMHKRYTNKATYNMPSSKKSTIWQRLKTLSLNLRNFQQLHIPHAIVMLFVLFFCIIACVYLIKHPDLTNLIREANTHYTICSPHGQHSQPLKDCLHLDYVPTAMAHNRVLIQMLHTNAVQHYCVNSSLPLAIGAQEFIKKLMSQSQHWDMPQLLHEFQACVYLIKQNPQWNVAILNSEELSLKEHELQNYVANSQTRFVLIKPKLPLSCVLFNKIQRFFFIIGTAVLILAVGLIIYGLYRYIRNRQLERQTAVNNFCTEIINELIYEASLKENGTESKEIVINHLRDRLIPLHKRKSLLWSWQEALRLLLENESRIQFSSKTVNGEVFGTMRWLPNVMPDSRDLGFRKKWQSPAFDNANKIRNPPTSCLKIRHMFDSSEIKLPNLKKVIEDAIFEKVGPHCNILDIQLDTQTCCVYVRCGSEEDAGIVHNEINGWWFDKRLVSIKFLRLQRYLSRFPES